MPKCPLCHSSQTQLSFQDKKRSFYLCGTCDLVFADAQSHFPHHIQNSHQQNKRHKLNKHSQFINTFINTLAAETGTELTGLNYGCPLPQEHVLTVKHGHTIEQFNPVSSTNTRPLKHHYDFIACYQALEHFTRPAREWQQFSVLLKPNGWLGINTRLLTNIDAFSKWHHKNNHLHVCFYQSKTFSYLARHYGFELKFATDELILMQKTSESAITRDLNAS